jgi:hypothetical protein
MSNNDYFRASAMEVTGDAADALSRVKVAADSGPLHLARSRDWTAVLASHPDVADLDLLVSAFYPEADR